MVVRFILGIQAALEMRIKTKWVSNQLVFTLLETINNLIFGRVCTHIKHEQLHEKKYRPSKCQWKRSTKAPRCDSWKPMSTVICLHDAAITMADTTHSLSPINWLAMRQQWTQCDAHETRANNKIGSPLRWALIYVTTSHLFILIFFFFSSNVLIICNDNLCVTSIFLLLNYYFFCQQQINNHSLRYNNSAHCSNKSQWLNRKENKITLQFEKRINKKCDRLIAPEIKTYCPCRLYRLKPVSIALWLDILVAGFRLCLNRE